MLGEPCVIQHILQKLHHVYDTVTWETRIQSVSSSYVCWVIFNFLLVFCQALYFSHNQTFSSIGILQILFQICLGHYCVVICLGHWTKNVYPCVNAAALRTISAIGESVTLPWTKNVTALSARCNSVFFARRVHYVAGAQIGNWRKVSLT